MNQPDSKTAKRYPTYSIIRPDGSTIDTVPLGAKSKRRLRSFRRMVERLGISGIAVAKNGVRVWTFIRFQPPKDKFKAKLALVTEEAN